MSNVHYDSLIFDVDGTLWDSVEVAAKAWNTIIDEMGLEKHVTGKELQNLFGRPMDVIFNTLFPGLDPGIAEEFSEKCMAYENELLLEYPGTVYPHVTSTIRELSKKMPLFIVSNCQSGYIEVCMKDLGIEEYITDSLCFGDRPVSKGANIRFLAKKHGLKAPAYVGDTQGDADACVEAGVPIIFADYGFGSVKAPDLVISDFKELLDLCQ
jgi:phosphoglycolate phosphatase